MPKLRPDQLLSLLCLITVWVVVPFEVPVKAESEVAKLAYEPLPKVDETFFFPRPTVATLTKPTFTAKSYIVYDATSGSVLLEKNMDRTLPQASLTKLMTAVVALEQYSLDDVVTIHNDEQLTSGNVMQLQEGESITVSNLLQGLLVYSSNDAAEALANFHPEGRNAFIAQMNQKAQALHLTESSFQNPTGFDEYNHFSSARDVALLTKEVFQNPLLKQIMQQSSVTVTNVDGTIVHELHNTNELLHNLDGVIAGKTGSTLLAGECLVTETVRNNHPIITVVLGSTNRFGETEQLIDLVYTQYEWIQPIPTQ